MKRVLLSLSLAIVLALSVAPMLSQSPVQAADADRGGFAQPHPRYPDYWYFGRSGAYAYSEYYLAAPTRLGSGATVQGIGGVGRKYAHSDYGWASAWEKKAWYWIRAEAYYSWYNF